VKIIPTILEQRQSEAEARIARVKDRSRWMQVDVIDGIYSRTKTFELELLKRMENCERALWDIHLMVKEPIKWVEKCVFVDASRVIGQVEMMSDREEFVAKVKDLGMEVGLAFELETEIDKIPDETDLVLLMGRKSGFESRNLDEGIYKRIAKVKELGFKVGVDGGATTDNLDKLEEAKVDIVYSGNQFEKIDDEKNE